MNNLRILLLFFQCISLQLLYCQSIGDYRTATNSVNYNNASHWQVWDGTKWTSASSEPGSSNDVYIQSGHTATLTANQSCKSLFVSSGSNSALTGDGLLALQTYSLSVYGQLNCYYGAVNTTNNSGSALAINDTTITPSLPISKSSGGVLKFVGDSRAITTSTAWGGSASGSNSLFDIDFALNANQTGTFNTIVKAANWIISSGILQTNYRIAVDNNTTGQGNLTINEGAKIATSESGSSTPIISRTASTRCGTITINGILNVSGLSPFIESSNITMGSTGCIEFSRSGNQNFINAAASGAVTLVDYKHIILSGTGTKTTLPALTTSILANGSLSMSGASIAVGSGATFAVNSTNTTLIYAGSSSQTASSNEWLSNFQNLYINNSAGVSLAFSRTINGTLTLGNGVFTHSGNLTLGNGASIIRTGGSIQSSPNFGSSINIIYNEHSNPIISGYELPSSSSIINHLTINTSQGVVLSTSITINGVLTLTNGLITTTASNLINLANASSVSGASHSSFIHGPITKHTNSTSTFNFPIGKGNTLRPLSITPANTNSSSFTAEYFNTYYTDTSSLTSPIKRVSKIDYFILNRSTSGTPSDASIALTWGSNSGVNTSNVNELTIARYAGGSSWVNEASTGSGNSSAGLVTSNAAVSNFGIFALANANSNNNQLPVHLTYFKINAEIDVTQLIWATASEINCKGFEIQKSCDALLFNPIGWTNSSTSNGFSNQISHYTFPISPLEKAYYRLKQMDNSGEFTYSPIIQFKGNGALSPIIISNKTIRFTISSELNHDIEIHNGLGKQIIKTSLKNDDYLDLNLYPSGIYFLKINLMKPMKIYLE
jgi:hypothetical protein